MAARGARPVDRCRLRRRLFAGLLLIVLTGGAWAQTPSEHEVKAAFLVNFAKYVEWPKDVLPSATTAIRLCILGTDPFGATLDEMAAKQMGQERPLIVQRVDSPAAATECQIVFMQPEYRWQTRRDLADLRGHSILTVGESTDFIEDGGIIAFRLEEGRVRLTISLPAARQAGLKISSRLLKLAQIVE